MRSPILHQPEPFRSLDTENHVRRRRASVASLRPVLERFGRRTRLPIDELVHGRALRRDSDGREHLSDYFPDKGCSNSGLSVSKSKGPTVASPWLREDTLVLDTPEGEGVAGNHDSQGHGSSPVLPRGLAEKDDASGLRMENVRCIPSVPSPVKTRVQRYLSSLAHVSPTETTGVRGFCDVPKPGRIPVKTILSSSTERDWAATEASRTMWGQGGSLVPRKPSKMPLWLRRNVEQIFSDSPSEDVPHGTFLADREVSADTSLGSDTPPNRSERLSGKSFGFIPQTIQRPHAATRPAESLLRGSTDVAGARPSIKRPRVNRTEAASKRGAPALRPSTGSFFLRGSVPSATAATSGTNEVGGVTCAASTSVVNRREGNPSVPNAATSSAKNTQRMLRESRKAEAAKDDSWTQWKTSTREKLPARRPEYDPKFFTTRVQGVEAASPLSPRPFKRKTSTTFFAQTERKDGRPVEDLASSSPRASSNAPGNSVGVRNGYDAKQKPAKTLEASALRPLPGVAPSSPRCLDVGSRRNRKEKRTRIASAEASPGHRSEEVALFQQLVAQLRRDLKSQRNLPPLLSRDARDVSRSQGLDMANEGLSKQKMAAAVLPAKRPRGRPSATSSGPIVPPVEGRLPDHPEGTAAPREDASTSSDSRFSELSGLGAQSRRKLVSGGEVNDLPTEKSLNVSPERIAHKRRVFTKQRRDVELLDGELRPVGKTAPVGLGLLVSTDHVTVGILRLLPSAVKGYSETRDHDTILLTTDNSVVVERRGSWEVLSRNSSSYICRGMPYSIRNISPAPAEVYIILVTPC
ncbi:uncharacterized protein LOC8024435 isoform X2 [Ixodes scapularis]|uniref:uncharacterized protein LOC8024435 isoform X2 n=1 Tax=Ixodes scapularis TaxID=6945 RepID=UPI001C3853D5|nr:uncharacterized protein LOC8024435 isoform X2 [Ixodes scapularis]